MSSHRFNRREQQLQMFDTTQEYSERESSGLFGLSFAETPRQLNFIHATCYTASLHVVDFKCAPNFGEAVCPGKVDMFSRMSSRQGWIAPG